MDGAFDSLAWDPELGWWSGAAEIAPGHHIELHVQAADEPGPLRAAIGKVRPLWDRLRAVEPSVRAAIAGQMIDAYNDLCDPEDEVTPEQFTGRLRLLSALFESDGGIELCYHDGMLFGGHQLIVPMASDGSVGEVNEAG